MPPRGPAFGPVVGVVKEGIGGWVHHAALPGSAGFPRVADWESSMQKKDVDRRVLIAGLGGAVAGSLLARNAVAGSLNPPAGGVSPSGRDLTQVTNMIARTDQGCAMPPVPVESLPGSASAKHVISVSGSYYLVGNIQGNPGQNVIDVQASHVDICGGGFHIFVPSGASSGVPSGCGIVCSGQNVTFYDGSVIGGRVGIDFSQASRYIIWDVISIGAEAAGFQIGGEGNFYDSEAHSCQNVGVLATGARALIEEGAVYSCPVGYMITGAQNIFFNNFATNCQTPFQIGPGNSYGPLVNVAGVGDMSAVPGSTNPWANFAY